MSITLFNTTFNETLVKYAEIGDKNNFLTYAEKTFCENEVQFSSEDEKFKFIKGKINIYFLSNISYFSKEQVSSQGRIILKYLKTIGGRTAPDLHPNLCKIVVSTMNTFKGEKEAFYKKARQLISQQFQLAPCEGMSKDKREKWTIKKMKKCLLVLITTPHRLITLTEIKQVSERMKKYEIAQTTPTPQKKIAPQVPRKALTSATLVRPKMPPKCIPIELLPHLKKERTAEKQTSFSSSKSATLKTHKIIPSCKPTGPVGPSKPTSKPTGPVRLRWVG